MLDNIQPPAHSDTYKYIFKEIWLCLKSKNEQMKNEIRTTKIKTRNG